MRRACQRSTLFGLHLHAARDTYCPRRRLVRMLPAKLLGYSIRQHTSAYVSIRRLVRMPAKLLAIAFCVSICTLGVLGGSKVPRVVSRADFVRVESDESPASECGGELSSELTKPLATELTKPL